MRRELAEESGIEYWGRVPALNTNPTFIDDLAEAVAEALPYAGSLASGGGSVAASASGGSRGAWRVAPVGVASNLYCALLHLLGSRRTAPAPPLVWLYVAG